MWIQEVLKKIDHHNIDKEVAPFSEGLVKVRQIVSQILNSKVNKYISHIVETFPIIFPTLVDTSTTLGISDTPDKRV